MTAIEESAVPSGVKADWKRSKPAAFDTNEAEIDTNNRRDENGANTGTMDHTVVKLLYQLMVANPTLGELQALWVWPYQTESHSGRLHLLMVGRPTTLHSAMQLHLDDAVARWVWQHQRPLTISTEGEHRFPDFSRVLLKGGIKHFCAVPLMTANRRIGVLGLASAQPDAFHNFKFDCTRGSTSPNPPEPGERLFIEAPCLDEEECTDEGFDGIVGRSPAINVLRAQVKTVAPTNSTVLILGETGTGKELIGRAIHNLSSRCASPFIKVNCAAIPAGLIESELFGHERGAFTGAVGRRIGRFEMAHGGTLFLDEIGDLPLELQPKLLRVLQEQEFERVGSTQTTRVNVRIVAATSRDLPRMVAAREFRADLYYRLNVFPLRMPALRERPDDIPLLVRHFVDLYSDRMSHCVKDVTIEAMEVLSRYSWPGNVRELQNVIERAVILSPGKVLRPSLEELSELTPTANTASIEMNGAPTTLKDAEREHIIQALAATNWVLGGPRGAGARLGLARTTLIAKMHKLGISRAQA